MILANVAAAETLEAARSPLIYRVHDEPSLEKMRALGEVLASIGIKLPKDGALRPALFNRILASVAGLGAPDLHQRGGAAHARRRPNTPPRIYGHFGLNLRRYAHFTSPIRRYADLIVHRALIRALQARRRRPAGPTRSVADLAEIGAQISAAERRAMAAERETIDRLIAHHLADRIGATFEGRISGVTRAGLFVKLAETGADGFVPASTIGADYYRYDEGTPRAGRRAHRRDLPPRRPGRGEAGRGRAGRRRAALRAAVRRTPRRAGASRREGPAARRTRPARPRPGVRAGRQAAYPEGAGMDSAGRVSVSEPHAAPACRPCGAGFWAVARLAARAGCSAASSRCADHCDACGQAFHHHRADDFPAYIVIFLVGHVVGYGICTAETRFEDVPLWFHVIALAGLDARALPRAAAAREGRRRRPAICACACTASAPPRRRSRRDEGRGPP